MHLTLASPVACWGEVRGLAGLAWSWGDFSRYGGRRLFVLGTGEVVWALLCVALKGGVKVMRAAFVWTFRRNRVESGTVLLGQDRYDRGPSGVKKVRQGLLHVERTFGL